MPGRSKLTATDEERIALRLLAKSVQRGEADRARAILLTLDGRRAEIGPRAVAIAETILSEDTRHDGGWTLPRLCAAIVRRGGPAISPTWLSRQLRQRGLPGVGRATRSKGARMPRRWMRAAGASPI